MGTHGSSTQSNIRSAAIRVGRPAGLDATAGPGGAIVAIVLSLPTVDPLMLSAIMSEDMYLAGSLLMVLSLLGVSGVLVSDLLLMLLIREFEWGARRPADQSAGTGNGQ